MRATVLELGRAFQCLTPATDKARLPKFSRVAGMSSACVDADHKAMREGNSEIG